MKLVRIAAATAITAAISVGLIALESPANAMDINWGYSVKTSTTTSTTK